MTATITPVESDATITHQSWCTEHVHAGPEVGPAGWCSEATETHGTRVELASDIESLGGEAGIELYAPSDTWLTATQAREVAAAIFVAAHQLDGGGALALSIRDASIKTSIAEYEIRCAINVGDLPAKKVGNRIVILAPALAAWLQSLEDVAR